MLFKGATVFYSTDKNEHNLPYDAFKACVAPRLTGWILTLSAAGVTNIAPYSFLNGPAPSQLVKPLRIAQSPINKEYRLVQTIDLMSTNSKQPNAEVIGHVVGLHIDEAILSDGKIDNTKLKFLTRLGYKNYASVEKVFSMDRPGDGDKFAGIV